MDRRLRNIMEVPQIVHANKKDLKTCMHALWYGKSPTKFYRRVINVDGDIAIASNLAILELVEPDFSPMTYDLTDDDVYIIKALCDDYHKGKVENQEEIENE